MKISARAAVDKFTDFKPFGRFTIRDDNKLVGVGMVIELTKSYFQK